MSVLQPERKDPVVPFVSFIEMFSHQVSADTSPHNLMRRTH